MLENYKVFKKLSLANLPPLAIFVGENGSGKSTLFDVFGFLSDALAGNVSHALAKRGGFGEVMSRRGQGTIKIELQFRLKITGKERLVTYSLELAERKGKPYVRREVLRYKRGAYGSPYHFLDFSDGKGYAVVNEEDFDKADEELDRDTQKLSPDTLAVKGVGQFERFKAASAFRHFIENWHVSDFHISDARPSRDAGIDEHLSPTGDNLPLVARFMFDRHRGEFDAILAKLRHRAPGVEQVKVETTVDGRIVLQFQDGAFKDPFIARYVSDGTIKMFAYLILLHDPHPHPLLCVEEPENQLYPKLLRELCEEFRGYAKRGGAAGGGQVFVSTHSPDFLNAARLNEVYWLDKKDGYTVVNRASDNANLAALAKEGLMGDLWMEGLYQV